AGRSGLRAASRHRADSTQDNAGDLEAGTRAGGCDHPCRLTAVYLGAVRNRGELPRGVDAHGGTRAADPSPIALLGGGTPGVAADRGDAVAGQAAARLQDVTLALAAGHENGTPLWTSVNR